MSRSGIYDLEYGFIPDDDVPQEPPKQTNADRIRAMTDEELAEFLWNVDHNGLDEFCNKNPCPPNESCTECMLEWLKKEVEDG